MTERIKIDLELISGALVYLCEIIDLEYGETYSHNFKRIEKLILRQQELLELYKVLFEKIEEYAWSNDFEITKKIKAITESEGLE